MKYILIVLLSTFFLQAKQEVMFIKNQGQLDSEVLYYAKYNGLNVFMKNDGFYYDFYEDVEKTEKTVKRKGHIVKLNFVNSNYEKLFTKENVTKLNFFKGNDQSKWLKNVETTKEIVVNNVYKNIDLKMYFDDDLPRYDLILHPNSNPEVIEFDFSSAYNTQIENDKIRAFLSVGDFYSNNLYAYQVIEGQRVQVQCSFKESENGKIKFDLGDYDKNIDLVIDPIIFSTLVGWSGDDYVSQVRTKSNSVYYVGGVTESIDFPISEGAYQQELAFEKDVFLMKYSTTGAIRTNLVSTYFGGSDDDMLTKLKIGTDDRVYICGNTFSNSLPMKGTLSQDYKGKQDGFVAVLSDNIDELFYAYYVGGSEDDGLNDIEIVDGKVFFCGFTKSTNFQTVSPFQNSLRGEMDGILGATRINGTSFEFATFFGGTSDDIMNGIDVDAQENLYFCGSSNSSNFRLAPTGQGSSPYNPEHNGQWDIVVGKFSKTAANILLSTYFGGTGNDYGIDVFTAPQGKYFFVGTSEKEQQDEPFIVLPEGSHATTNHGGMDIVFGRLTDEITGTRRFRQGWGWVTRTVKTQDLDVGTFAGGRGDDVVYDAAISPDRQSVLIGGYTTSNNFPEVNNEERRIRYAGMKDGFLIELNSGGRSVEYSTYINGSDDETVRCVDFFPNGQFIFGGETISNNFHTTGYGANKTKTGKSGFLATIGKGSFIYSGPNGGEKFCPGAPMNISWTRNNFAEGDGFDVYLTNDKLNYKSLIQGQIKGSILSWTVPNNTVADSNYKILVSHLSGFHGVSEQPFIINQTPKLQTFTVDKTVLCPGESITLTASATDVFRPKYNWEFKNNIFSSSNNNTTVLDNLTPESSGNYSVEIEGECNPSAKSDNISVDVAKLTAITQQSDDIKVEKGKTLTIQIQAEGGELTYQWLLNGSELSGQTSNILTINSVVEADGGDYTCRVAGRCGNAVTSDAINVIVETQGSVRNNKYFDTFYYDGDNLNADLKVEHSGLAITKILDIQGKEVYTGNIFLNQGTNKLTIPANFENGTYLFNVIINQKVLTYKFAVIK
jgi:hypothetical protein